MDHISPAGRPVPAVQGGDNDGTGSPNNTARLRNLEHVVFASQQALDALKTRLGAAEAEIAKLKAKLDPPKPAA